MPRRPGDAPRDGAHPDDFAPVAPTDRSDETARDSSRHHSRAPAYWDDLDDSGATPVPGPDVLSAGGWDASAAPRWSAQEQLISAPRRPGAEELPGLDPEPPPDPMPEPEPLSEPTESSPHPDAPTSEALVTDALAEEAPARRRPVVVERVERWARPHRARLLWIAAFVAGTVLGGVAVHEWDTQQAEARRRDTVQLSARVAEDAASSANWTGDRQPWTLRVVLTNSGPTDVRIGAARLDDKYLRSKLRTVSRDVRVRAGQETWISVDVTNSCSVSRPMTAPYAIMLTITPDGRPERDVRVRLADDTMLLVDTARQKCQNSANDMWITAELEGEPADLDTELATPIRIRQLDERALAVREIRTPTPGLSVVAAPLPIGFEQEVTPATTLRWSIADCAKARVIVYAEVGISATIQLVERGESVRVPIVLDANAVLAIVRFITRTCG
ncbi:hypothetical protein [Cryptosporangium minutisporangium]|uniref:Uncharacterized protein n=1 Tax=Cryptosporangium minutisporangium TaxID=113569 RepID=A0ABP6T904_9ACTN